MAVDVLAVVVAGHLVGVPGDRAAHVEDVVGLTVVTVEVGIDEGVADGLGELRAGVAAGARRGGVDVVEVAGRLVVPGGGVDRDDVFGQVRVARAALVLIAVCVLILVGIGIGVRRSVRGGPGLLRCGGDALGGRVVGAEEIVPPPDQQRGDEDDD